MGFVTVKEIADHIIENGYHKVSENLNSDGSVNWNYVSADVYLDGDFDPGQLDGYMDEAIDMVIAADLKGN